MREDTAVAAGLVNAAPPADWGEGETLAAALAAALVEYKKCVGGTACGQAAEAPGGLWRTLGRWEQMARARRA